MNVVSSSVSRLKKDLQPSSALPSLNLYRELPDAELSLDDFEVYALKRLKVLRKLEQLELQRLPLDQVSTKLDAVLKQQDLLHNVLIDTYSHFILRLSYCQTDELRRWFLKQECALFRHRLVSLNQDQLASSVQTYAKLEVLDEASKQRLLPQLSQLYNSGELASMAFYVVPFAQALDLVGKRQALVQGGRVYVPQAKVYGILVARFRAELSKQLVLLAHQQGMDGAEEGRIRPLLQNLHQCLVQPEQDASNSDGSGRVTLTATNISSLVQHMPLCMRQLHTGLTDDKHLKHWARLQYGLFLKGAGLSLDDALLFFQRHFQKVTNEQFQKQYAYGIRHYYGKEGKRATYTPYSCSKIIVHNAAPASHGEHHGCPYRHYDVDQVGRLLQKLQVGNAQDRAAILKLKQEGHFQLACLKQFHVQHPQALERNSLSMENVGNHPNAWFRASLEYAGGSVVVTTTDGAGATSSLEGGTDDDRLVSDAMEVSPEK